MSDPNGDSPTNGENPPEKLYTNTNNAKGVLKDGFKGRIYGKFSKYNWFSKKPNAKGTGRVNQGATLTVEGIDVSKAHTITKAQTSAWRLEATSELGHTKESLKALQKSDPKAYGKVMSQIDGLRYSKLGVYMDKLGKSVYYVEKGGSYAISDAVANTGTVTGVNASPSQIKLIKGLKIGGRVLTVAAIGMDMYEIHTSSYKPRTIVKKVGAWTGAWAGAKAGAWIGGGVGTTVGSAFAGIGAVPGGTAGSIIGSIAGGISGYFAGEYVTETVYDRIITRGFKIKTK